MSPLFSSVLVANRGEIAVRIMATLRRLGIGAVAVYSDADRGARHVRHADTSVALGGTLPAESYLNIDAVVEAALRAGVDAVHPGYGFLSENHRLAAAVADAGLAWVGPPASVIEAMGDKIRARRLAAAAGVAVVPAWEETHQAGESVHDAAARIGYPVLLKPSAGGGGKGMRVVSHSEQLDAALEASRREALAAFGDDTMLVEKFVDTPRHIEVQVLSDGRVTLALGERECSLQRRHQKIVEETPSPALDEAARAGFLDAARRVAEACGYVNAGTVEFIASSKSPGDFYFMEMNTRLQVEHPVTEMVTGVDLVEWQLRVAAGETLEGLAFEPRGHAVEARVYAEDATGGFLPATGTLLAVSEPAGDHVRVDSGVEAGDVVSTAYDPMLAKVAAWGPDRATALARLDDALRRYEILGVTTNVAFLTGLLARPQVREGRLHTGLVEAIAADVAAGLEDGWAADLAVAAAAHWLTGAARALDPWEVGGGWRLGDPVAAILRMRLGRAVHEVTVAGTASDATVVVDAQPVPVRARRDGRRLLVEAAGVSTAWTWASDGDAVWLSRQGHAARTEILQPGRSAAGAAQAGHGEVTSPMPGTVRAVHVEPGQSVTAGQPLVVLEAMKMEYTLNAPTDGVVDAVHAAEGDTVAIDDPLVSVSATGEDQ